MATRVPLELQTRFERRVINIVPELLCGYNYGIWSACMKSYLLANDLWDTIEIEGTGGAANPNPNPRELLSEVELKAWRKKNAAAVHAIKISCRSKFLHFIIDIKTAKHCWECLASMPWAMDQIMREEYLKGQDPNNEEFWKFELHPIEEEERNMNTKFRKMVDAIERGDIDGVTSFLDKHGRECTRTSHWTAVHHATWTGNLEIVKILSEFITLHEDPDLAMVIDDCGRTVLTVAAAIGDMKIIEYFVSKNNKLLMVPDKQGDLPVDIACYHGHIEATRYLYSLIPFDFLLRENGTYASSLLRSSIWRGMFDISLDLLRRCPRLTTTEDTSLNIPIHTICGHSGLFPSGNKYVFWKKWIYSCIKVQIPTFPADVNISIPYDEHMRQSNMLNQVIRGLGNLGSKALELFGVKEIYDQKLRHAYTLEIVRCMCENISTMDRNELIKNRVCDAFIRAVKYGIIEVVIAMLKANPSLLNTSRDINGNNVLMAAVFQRQGKIFSLVYAMLNTRKYGLLSEFNGKGDNILHLAAILARPSRLAHISGAALQMQRELQWYKEVKSIVNPSSLEAKNRYGLKAGEIFSDSHKQLVSNGEKWMKETATSSTVVGALIITIMFTAAFTVPGGYIQDTGFPIFLHQTLFKLFLVSDAISLFASSTSVLMFLSVLNSRYAEQDFLKSLPRKLIIGLSTLFISISSMMVAFCVTLMLMLRGELELVIPIFVMLAIVPITLFVLLQFPLLVEIFVSTYVPCIFDRKMQYLY